jgi:Zn-dependent peptidase ImmA (M78 family)
MTVRLTPPERETLARLAAAWGVSESAAFRRALIEAAERVIST